MTTSNLSSIIESNFFREQIKQAIESGKGTDWGFNGESEFEYPTFDSDHSLELVIEVLKKHFITNNGEIR